MGTMGAYDDSEGVPIVAMQPGQGVLRAARTLIVVLLSVWLGSLAHAAGGGCVTVGGVALTAGVLAPATWMQLSRQRSQGFLLAWLTLGQVVAHGLLEVGCHGPAHIAAGPGPVMLGLHSAAVLLIAAALGRGEALVWAGARWLCAVRAALVGVARRLTRLAVPQVCSCSSPRVALPAPVSRHRSLWCSARPARRGPPVATRCCA
jgi:hypothetical protein